jgi:hypothetical protein
MARLSDPSFRNRTSSDLKETGYVSHAMRPARATSQLRRGSLVFNLSRVALLTGNLGGDYEQRSGIRYLLRMSFLDLVRSLFHNKEADDERPYSIVLLLRSPFAMSKEVLETAASKAYRMPYDGSHAMYFVVPNPLLTTVKAGAFLITVLEIATPYLGDPAEVAQGFEDRRLSNEWIQHRMGWRLIY